MVPTTSSIMLTTVAKIGRWIEISEISMAGVYYGHPMDQVDVVIVGAGVVGLAVARALAAAGREVLILEAESAFGTGISARNSEVIHAGIYYPRGSLKARLCVAGRDRLYAYCNERGVPHRRCGKLIVATSEAQLGELAKIQAAAAANGVALDLLPASEARALEPALSCTGALSSPSTGIVDSHAYMLALLGDAEAHGATLVCGSGVKSAEVHADGIELHLEQGEDTLRAKLLVNCAGLGAPQLAGAIRGFPQQHVPRAWLAKGHYFTLSGRSPFQRLVYPVPEPGGLGIHLTLDLAGRARFGPDVQWIERLDYEVAAAHGEKFYAAIRRYWPALADGSLQPAYAGIRPKISGPGEPAADFRIEGPEAHGVPGVINLFGIESPGLTASLAIAEQVQLMTVR
jgi:L-2-hydroxyglutarate oxidase LhgO